MESKLKIYRASAGSGKTFTLALEYMKLLVENPYCYRNILAVTFTNKATGEMKERILGKLYGVANGSESAKDYLAKLCEELPHIGKDTIIANARKAFYLILHDYGHFRIQTIDAFFQTVLRSLAKELDLAGDIEISLDDKEALENAVDCFIRNLEPDTKSIAQVINFIDKKHEEGSDWHVDKDLKEFAKNILREEYQQRGEELQRKIESSNGVVLDEFYNKVDTYRKKITATAKSIGEEFFALTEGYTVNDFRGKSTGLWKNFTQLKNGETPELNDKVLALIDEPQKISSVFADVEQIAKLLKRAAPLHREKINCDLSLKHFHQLSLINNIAETLKEENARENRFMIGETAHLLSSMIGLNTTFIFEKIGTEIDHIFIDEFQDTSKLQWSCFKVLLEEVLARGKFNLIVGDVKQSIYRWRNSDWNIMNNIGSYFRKDRIEFADQTVKKDGQEFRSTNYRSDGNIVAFNNAFYRAAIRTISCSKSESLGERRMKELTAAYEDVEQALPLWKQQGKGYAEVRVVPKQNAMESFNEYGIEELMKTLHRLLDEEKIEPGNIAILVRYNKVMPRIVEAFNAEFPNTRIVSDDAYRLSSSTTIQLVISAMRYIAAPEDKVNIANMARLYHKVVGNGKDLFEEKYSLKEIEESLPLEFRNELNSLKGLPVYELIEQLLLVLGMSEDVDEESYIYTFLDYATQYLNGKVSDLNGFLEAWDESINEKSIPAEHVNSVRLMSIHKSKGLEFHTVIVPICAWPNKLENTNSIWCEPKEEPFNTLSLLSIQRGKDIPKSIYSDDDKKETLYQLVDNLNILYVATTRAKSNLFLFSDGSGGSGETISKIINAVTPNLTVLEGSEYNDGVFTFGKIVNGGSKKEETVNDNPFEAKAESLRQPFVHYRNRITFRQSRELARFLATDKEEKTLFKNIAEGELLHLVMSGINGSDDVKKTLDKLTIDGLIATEKQYDSIKRLVERALSNPKAKDWFSGKYRLYNECSILVSDGDETTRRPDRVMIDGDDAVVVDYKFAREDAEHERQVQRYMGLLARMGYRNVKGYLWYVYKNEIKEVCL